MKKWLSMFIITLFISVPAFAWDFGVGAVYIDSTDILEDTTGINVFARTPVGTDAFAQFNLGTADADLNSDSTGQLETNWLEASLLLKRGIWYAGGGVGWYWFDISIPENLEIMATFFGLNIDADVGNEVGFFARTGVELPVNDRFSLVADVKYTWLEAKLEGDLILPGFGAIASIDSEGSLDGFSVTLGGSYAFG